MASRGRPKLRTNPKEIELVKEVRALNSRLNARLKYLEKKGLENYYSEQIRNKTFSTKGLGLKGLKSLRRELLHELEIRSTTAKGARQTKEVWNYIQDTIDIKSKSKRQRVYHLVNKALEQFSTFRYKNFRYEVRDIVNKLVQAGKQNRTILKKLQYIADSTGKRGTEDSLTRFKKAKNKILLELDDPFDEEDYF